MSMTIDYQRFHRLVTRCKELGTHKDTKPLVTKVYKDLFQTPAEAYLTAGQAMLSAESTHGKEGKEASQALKDIDQPYRSARAVAMAYVPTLSVPDTLKRQPTDTDKMIAVETLLTVIDDYTGQSWADELLKGEFGTLAPKVIQEVSEAIDANKGLSEARNARSMAYGPAYEQYLAFKRVVRAEYGPKSFEYKRIHLRSSGGPEEEEAAPPPAAGGEPGPA